MAMRKRDWLEILFRELESMADREFVRGKLDCCLFAADIVQAITGEDYAKAYRGTYKSKKGAAVALRKHGKGKIENSIPLPIIDIQQAGRGDIVLADFPDGPAVGICVGAMSAFKAQGMGLAYHPTLKCCMAWRV